ncbi:hypothetical protein, variant 1 [Aphanomyces invadans]|uniref:Aquaporin n=1 Tax=Aphanomyces invadans TaxID=157072 RepID=A0A024UF06_9STRA|nr:hypothetical protein, variant 1 [Aphanomyces invadans]ETW04795.1 hypothetical protein, variant 1 [Aphanomyces invadans]|eukprot:XP_008866232.1 hypothetical protein, variant 1 [Aphanomyces invadans]
MTGVVPTDDDDQPLRPDNSTFDTITLPLSTTSLTSILHARCRVASSLGRECMSEFFATFVMMGFGTGSGAQVALSNGQHGNYTHITLCWGIAVMLGIHIGGAISGAHMNPAVSFTWCVLGKFPWMKLPWYCISQYDPAFSIEKSGRIFVSGPQVTETLLSAFITEVLCAAFLIIGVLAITHPSNPHMNALGIPTTTGLLVVGIGMAFGLNTGYAVNPAADLGCRLFALVAGWGPIVFTVNDGYWWIPLVAPCLGGVLGGCVYTISIDAQHPDKDMKATTSTLK